MKTPKENISEEPPKESIYRSEKAKKRVEGIEFTPILDAKQTVEIVERPKSRLEEIEKIEKPEPKPENKIETKKEKNNKISKTEKTRKKGIIALSGNSILIITEKPQAAAKIASALSGGRERKDSDNGIPFYEFKKNGENVIVACAVGHLFSLSQDVKGSDYPIFEVSWKPNFEVRKKDFTRKYYNALTKLVKRAKEVIVASVDYNEFTPVIEGGNMKIVKIGELVDSIVENRKQISSFLIPAFDSNGKIKFNQLKQAIRHPIKEDLYELSLDYGRKVRLTSSHNIFTIQDNKIKMLKTITLKIGDKILCPKSLPIPINKNSEINLLDLINFKNKHELFLEGEDIARILKERILKKIRKNHPLNDERIILSKLGAKILKQIRIKKGYSTAKIAKIANISQPSIVYWEKLLKNPSKNKFIDYLRALEISPINFMKNQVYCRLENSSFKNLLENVYTNQHKNFSNFTRATLKLKDLKNNEIKGLQKAFIYGSKNKRNKLPINLKIDKDFIRIMGYFLAEGDINQDYRIRFSLGLESYGHEQKIINEIKTFCDKYNLNYNYYIHKIVKHQILTIDNSVLASLFKNVLGFGNGARNKRIINLIFNLPLDLKKEFLRAYFLGDGSLGKTNISFNTSSELLAKDISYLLLQFGILSSTYRAETTGKGGGPTWHVTVSGKENLNKIKEVWIDHHKSKTLYLAKSLKKRNYEELGDLALLKIKDIKKVKSNSKYVYDLSVEGQNFIAGDGGICCHNTDYDVEGEVIGYNFVRFIANQKDAKRMKFSSLTTDELEEAYKNVHPTIDWGQAIAGETRHFIDWYYGINLSRALMNSIKTTGKFRIMSIGRVQGPALNMIVEKEKEIAAFKPIPFWRVFIDVIDKEKQKLRLKYVKDIFAEKELAKFEKLKGKEGDAKTEKTQQTIIPPAPFDLTTLQTEAYKFFYISPSRTLQIAQQLYLSGLISYPRTSSQKIPEAINPKEILKKLLKKFPQVKLAVRQTPVEGKKNDPAHPSISPTGEFQQLSGEDQKIYELIVRRFISCFSSDAKIENKTITVSVGDLLFKERGLEIKEKGWMEVYDAKLHEKELKDMNGKVKIEKVEFEKDETKPPRRFSPASIISELEKRGLGTKATRANIIETLYDRNYITDNRSIKATSLGISLIDTLRKHSPVIIDEKLTRDMEKDMERIRESKKELEKREEETLEKARKALKQISVDFHKKEKLIGEDLIKATQEFWKQQNIDNEIGECPSCHKGKLVIKYSPKNKKHFVACNAYPNCKTTFSLPPFGMIKKIGENKVCDKCGFPLLMCLRKGKKPWVFCFNPSCPSRQNKSGVVSGEDSGKIGEESNVDEKERENQESGEE